MAIRQINSSTLIGYRRYTIGRAKPLYAFVVLVEHTKISSQHVRGCKITERASASEQKLDRLLSHVLCSVLHLTPRYYDGTSFSSLLTLLFQAGCPRSCILTEFIAIAMSRIMGVTVLLPASSTLSRTLHTVAPA